MYFSRVCIPSSCSDQIKIGFFNTYLTHQSLWKLFSESPEQKRNFLYRREDPVREYARFYILSEKEPIKHFPEFVIESKEYKPHLVNGDELQFKLRVNPVRRYTFPDGKSKRIDIVDHYRIKQTENERETNSRESSAYYAALQWMNEQGCKNGFELISEHFKVENYSKLKVKKEGSKKSNHMILSALDLSGVIKVNDSDEFIQRLFKGFGHSRSFGCGLMIIKRYG